MSAEYEAAKASRAPLDAEADAASKALRAFPKGPMGMTPQAVRDTPEFQAAYQRYARAAQAQAKFNGPFCKAFAKEIRAEVQAKREARLAAWEANQ